MLDAQAALFTSLPPSSPPSSSDDEISINARNIEDCVPPRHAAKQQARHLVLPHMVLKHPIIGARFPVDTTR
jgi:hypothetical protein